MFGLCLLSSNQCPAYSLLTHEELIDVTWKDQLEPLLRKRFPAVTAGQLRQAHAYAYGGSLIQDMGYYPFGSKFFSDLAHYVRTGDFVANLIRESADVDQYAFALGALAHYSSDRSGHPLINEAVALTFPKLREKYGDLVTYEQNPKAHIQTEFGFDITQVAKRRYTSDTYHDFIGFEVSRPVLERAFLRTYGVRLDQVLEHVDLAIGTFRHGVSGVIPQMTRAALTAYHPELVREVPNFNKQQFLYNLSRAQYNREWGKEYRKPGLFARLLGFLVRLVPKVGVLQGLAFQLPTPRTEDLYIASMNLSVADYRSLLREVASGNLDFPNQDCDTGRPTIPGEYALTDESYAELLERVMKLDPDEVPADLRQNLLAFYANPRPPARMSARDWRRTLKEIKALKEGLNSELAVQVRTGLLKPPARLPSPKELDSWGSATATALQNAGGASSPQQTQEKRGGVRRPPL